MVAYYNENDPKAAAWLRELIKGGHIAKGEVDERSIVDVIPRDLRGFAQCHFFAGIGGWSYALRLANWKDDRPVWTGSCPCQPFSAAGKGGGFADERHLWPAWYHLIEQCRPPVLFGEQVSSPDGLKWFGLVQADLEGADYAVGAFDLCAAGVGAPHIRQRLYFVSGRGEGGLVNATGEQVGISRRARIARSASDLGDSAQQSLGAYDREPGASDEPQVPAGGPSVPVLLADSRHEHSWRPARSSETAGGRSLSDASGHSFWNPCDWIECTDGKARPVEPSTFPLAHGISNRVGLLRGYGNAIVPQVAEAFIRSYLEDRPCF